MSGIDLAEATQAVDAALEQNAPTWTLGDREIAEIALTAALPHLERSSPVSDDYRIEKP